MEKQEKNCRPDNLDQVLAVSDDSPAACRNIVSCIAEVTENSVKSYFAAVHFP